MVRCSLLNWRSEEKGEWRKEGNDERREVRRETGNWKVTAKIMGQSGSACSVPGRRKKCWPSRIQLYTKSCGLTRIP